VIVRIRARFRVRCIGCNGEGGTPEGDVCGRCHGIGRMRPAIVCELRGCRLVKQSFNDGRVPAVHAQGLNEMPMCGTPLTYPKRWYGAYSEITCGRCLRNDYFKMV
jgi:hypothetical protein